jgi:hypothetical protein
MHKHLCFIAGLAAILIAPLVSANALSNAESRGREARNLTNQAKQLLVKKQKSQARSRATSAEVKAKQAINLAKQYQDSAKRLETRAKQDLAAAKSGLTKSDRIENTESHAAGAARVGLVGAKQDLARAEEDYRAAERDRARFDREWRTLYATGGTDAVTRSKLYALDAKLQKARQAKSELAKDINAAKAAIANEASTYTKSTREAHAADIDGRVHRMDESEARKAIALAKKMQTDANSAMSRFRSYLSQATAARSKSN